MTKSIRESYRHRNGRTEVCHPGLGSRSGMTLDPRLFLFFCLAIFIGLPRDSQHDCPTSKHYIQVRDQKRGIEGKGWQKHLCQPSLSLLIRKTKILLRRPNSQTSTGVLWARSMPQSHAEEQRRQNCSAGHVALLHKISLLLTRMCSISQLLFNTFQQCTPILISVRMPRDWLQGKLCKYFALTGNCTPYIIPMAVDAKPKTIWGTCYYAFVAVNLKYKSGPFLDITSILAITYDAWQILPSPNSLSDICKQEMKC